MKTIAIIYLVYLAWCFLAGLFGWDVGSSNDTYVEDHSSESEPLFDRIDEDGSWWVKDSLGINHCSNGVTSYTGFFNEEIRSNGEMVTENGWVYKDGKHIGYETTDALGITHRYDK